MAFLAERKLGECVSVIGLATGAQKTALFRDHGVFLFPSHFENSPVVLKEATQAGMAIISSDIPANLNVLTRSHNQLSYPSGNCEALAACMLRMMDAPELFTELRDRARKAPAFDEQYAMEVLRAYLT
jgi:glycosyltransferase involved in cell wall biosynthesis